MADHLNPGRIVLVKPLPIFPNHLALLSLNQVIFKILIFLRPNGQRSEEQGTDTDRLITQLRGIPTNSILNFSLCQSNHLSRYNYTLSSRTVAMSARCWG